MFETRPEPQLGRILLFAVRLEDLKTEKGPATVIIRPSRHFAIDVCDTPSRRAASAIVTSPRTTASTIRVISSTDFNGVLP